MLERYVLFEIRLDHSDWNNNKLIFKNMDFEQNPSSVASLVIVQYMMSDKIQNRVIKYLNQLKGVNNWENWRSIFPNKNLRCQFIRKENVTQDIVYR